MNKFSKATGLKYTPADFTHYLNIGGKPIPIPRPITQDEVDILNSDIDIYDYAYEYGVIPSEYARRFKLIGEDEQ